MRLALLISALPIIVPAIVAAQQLTPGAEIPLTPPGYKMLRFDEDYSYLTNQDNRTDVCDPVKYIPLRSMTRCGMRPLGASCANGTRDTIIPTSGFGGKGSDSYFVATPHTAGRCAFGRPGAVFTEGISGIIEGESQHAPPIQNDPIDLQFAFVDVVPLLKDDERLTLRVGRFGMSLGQEGSWPLARPQTFPLDSTDSRRFTRARLECHRLSNAAGQGFGAH